MSKWDQFRVKREKVVDAYLKAKKVHLISDMHAK